MPALHIAMVMGNPHIVWLLLEAHVDTKRRDKQYNLTALSFLSHQRPVHIVNVQLIVRFFIEAGSKSDEVSNAFHHAVMVGNVTVAAALLTEARELIPEDMLERRSNVSLNNEDTVDAYNIALQQLTEMGLIEPEPPELSLFSRIIERVNPFSQ